MLSNKAQHSLRMKQLLQWRWRADFPITLFSTAPVTSISSKRLNSSSSLKIKELLQESQSKNEVKIQGWVRQAQRHGKMLFLKINDGTCSQQIQAVVPRNVSRTINVGSAIQLHGRWVPSIGPRQDMEFFADECAYMNQPKIDIIQGDNDIVRPKPHLRPKLLEFASILRMRAQLNHLVHEFFKNKSFVHIDTPMLTLTDCEGASEAFGTFCRHNGYFDDSQAFLPVSGQLHLEAICCAIPNVYTLSPAFRADTSISRQHMAEFRMLEAEIAFMDSLEQLCSFVEEFLRFIIERSGEECADDFAASASFCKRDGENYNSQILAKCLEGRLDQALPRISFIEAVRILGRSPDAKDFLKSLNKKEEFHLVEEFQGPVFVTHFPSQQKPFYMHRTEDGQFAECFDLLVPFAGELAGGSVREWDRNLLAGRIPDSDGKLDWYLELRNSGYPRSSGFGLGVDRLMQALFGIENVKDTIPFPRWYRQALKC